MENGIDCVDLECLGKVWRVEDVVGCYIEFCKGIFLSEFSLEGLIIVVDSVNGVVYKVVFSVFEELGVKVINIVNMLNGININNDCGVIFFNMLSKVVMINKVDLGIVVDGDVDRIMFVDF